MTLNYNDHFKSHAHVLSYGMKVEFGNTKYIVAGHKPSSAPPPLLIAQFNKWVRNNA
jgi:hypothetical protein